MADTRAPLDALLAAVDGQLTAALAPFVASLVRQVRRSGAGSLGQSARGRITTLISEALTALFGGSPAAVFAADGTPLTPVARLLAAATRTATLVVVGPVIAEVQQRLTGQPDLLAALTGGRALPPGGQRPAPLFDPARTWITPDGYRLSDRLWLAGEDLRTRIDTLLDYHIGKGTTATVVADELEQFLTAEGAAQRTRRPYGQVGSHRARTLARTETSRAYNVATAQGAALNPFAVGVGYRLSGSHPKEDQCNGYATANPDGLGVGNYTPGNYPVPPVHPNCLCYTVTVLKQSSAAVIADLGRWARGGQVDGYDQLGSVPLEADSLMTWLTGFPAPLGDR